MAHRYLIKNKRFAFYIGAAGLFGITLGKDFHIHFLTRPSHWMWGRSVEEYDRSLQYLGFGPIALVVWNSH